MRGRLLSTVLCLLTTAALTAAQTRITPPKNSYTPQQDVELGRQAAAEVHQQLPIMRDDAVSSYLEEVGRRLVGAIPSELGHSEFRYTFEGVNVREINAFALPGGPMFVNRGMIEAARTEGEVAGVMAHELSHVILRHGTAQASKAAKYQIGEVAGALLGAIIGGRVGGVVAQTAQFGLGTAFLRYGREYERQADIEGSHIMARAGYDPRDMASMFKTIEKQGGSGGPEWLSDHPNPGNRSEYITNEAKTLRVENPLQDTQAFDRIRAHLNALPRAPTTEEATRSARRGTARPTSGPDVRPTGGVEPPASRFIEYQEGDLFRVGVPSNWREQQGSSSVTFAPDGAVGRYNGQGVFTHGVEIGIGRNERHDLQTATEELINSLSQGNPRLSRPSGYRRASVGGRSGLQTALENVSEVSGQAESIQIVSTLLRNGNLFYLIAVAPRRDVADYQSTFQRIVGSIRLRE